MDIIGASYVLLWAIVLVQGAVIVFLLRQVGAIYLGDRDAIERDGIEPGRALPVFEGRDYRGHNLGPSASHNKWTVFLYSVPTCQICRDLLQSIADLEHKLGGLARFVVLLESAPELLEQYLDETSRAAEVFTIDRSVSRRLRVRVSPFVHVVDPNGIVRAKGLVNSVNHIEHLLVTGGLVHESLETHVELKHGVAS